MRVADFWFILLERVTCRVKLFVNIISKNWFTPVICLYLVRLKLKSPTSKLLLFSRLILLSSFFIKSLLSLKCCMLGCLYVVPNIKLDLLGIRSSMKTDSSSLGYASVSLLVLCMIIFVIYVWAIHLLMIRLGFAQYYSLECLC